MNNAVLCAYKYGFVGYGVGKQIYFRDKAIKGRQNCRQSPCLYENESRDDNETFLAMFRYIRCRSNNSAISSIIYQSGVAFSAENCYSTRWPSHNFTLHVVVYE